MAHQQIPDQEYRHIIPISGKDSATTAIVQMARQPELEYEFIYNDTGSELPEVEDWLIKMEGALGKEILRIGAPLEDIIYEQGVLPSRRMRFCTRLAKIYPMEDWIAEDGRPAKIYLGIRADENRIGYESSRNQIEPVYPLQEMGIGIDLVYQILDQRQLAPPDFFWPSLYDMVYEELGLFGRDYAIEKLTRTQRVALFAWRTRMNCFYCFNQQVWEWVGLLEYHPELFDRAEVIENDNGAEGYSWREDWPLALIRQEASNIKQRRAKRVAQRIMKQVFKEDNDEADILKVVSCGLLCGK